MIRLIIIQRNMFLISLFLGVAIAAAYDLFRCLRRIVPHNNIVIAVEDLLFWLTWSVIIIYHIYKYNSGSLRWYIFLGMAIGAAIYLATFSRLLMYCVSRILSALKKCAKKINKMLKNSVKRFKM